MVNEFDECKLGSYFAEAEHEKLDIVMRSANKLVYDTIQPFFVAAASVNMFSAGNDENLVCEMNEFSLGNRTSLNTYDGERTALLLQLRKLQGYNLCMC